MIGKIFAVGAAVLGTALVIYVNNEIRKEYNACVDENDRMKDFIQNHDFYEKASAKADVKSSLHKENCYFGNYTVYTDEKTGFKLFEYTRKCN